MSHQGQSRSTTPVRQASALFPENSSNQNRLPLINQPRSSSRNLEISPIKATEQKLVEGQLQAEELRNNRSQLYSRNGNQKVNNFFAPDAVADPLQNKSQMLLKRFDHNSNFYNGWDQVVKGKAESEQRAILEQKNEERQRKQLYR